MNAIDGAVITKVIKIGNSQGIRIPKLLIEQCGLQSEVELVVQDGCLTIRPTIHPRKGWEEACIEMVENGDDKLVDEHSATAWDDTEWVW